MIKKTMFYHNLSSTDHLTVDTHVTDMHQTASCMFHCIITHRLLHHCWMTCHPQHAACLSCSSQSWQSSDARYFDALYIYILKTKNVRKRFQSFFLSQWRICRKLRYFTLRDECFITIQAFFFKFSTFLTFTMFFLKCFYIYSEIHHSFASWLWSQQSVDKY